MERQTKERFFNAFIESRPVKMTKINPDGFVYRWTLKHRETSLIIDDGWTPTYTEAERAINERMAVYDCQHCHGLGRVPANTLSGYTSCPNRHHPYNHRSMYQWTIPFDLLQRGTPSR